MSRLKFLSLDECDPDVAIASPLENLAGNGTLIVTDVQQLGKLEVRGEIESLDVVPGEHLLPLGPRRALVVMQGSPALTQVRLEASDFRVYDMTAALAALEFEGEGILRRLTELDPGSLPAIGSIARGTPALIERREGDRFRLYVPQELSHYVAEVIIDMASGVGR